MLIAQGKTLAIKTLEDLGHVFTDPPPVQAQPSSSRVPAGPTVVQCGLREGGSFALRIDLS